MVSRSSTEWNGLGLDHLELCNASIAWTCLSQFFQVISDFLSFVLKTTECFPDGFSVESSFLVLSKAANILFGTRLNREFQSFLQQFSHKPFGMITEIPYGRDWIKFPHFFQTAEHTAPFLSQRAQPTHDSQPSVHLQQTLTAFYTQENQLSGGFLVAEKSEVMWRKGDFASYILSFLKQTDNNADNWLKWKKNNYQNVYRRVRVSGCLIKKETLLVKWQLWLN